MKYSLVAILALLLIPAPRARQQVISGRFRKSAAPSGIALVNKATVSGTNGGTTSSVNMSGANLCIVGVAYYAAVTPSPSVSSSPSNTWVAGSTYASTNQSATIYYAYSPSVSSSMTFTNTQSSSYSSLHVACFSGSVGSSVDQQNGNSNVGTTSCQAGSVTPSANGEVIFNLVEATAGSSFMIDSGYTLLYSIATDSVTYFSSGSGYLIQTTAAATNPTLSWTTTAAAFGCGIATFK